MVVREECRTARSGAVKSKKKIILARGFSPHASFLTIDTCLLEKKVVVRR